MIGITQIAERAQNIVKHKYVDEPVVTDKIKTPINALSDVRTNRK